MILGLAERGRRSAWLICAALSAILTMSLLSAVNSPVAHADPRDGWTDLPSGGHLRMENSAFVPESADTCRIILRYRIRGNPNENALGHESAVRHLRSMKAIIEDPAFRPGRFWNRHNGAPSRRTLATERKQVIDMAMPRIHFVRFERYGPGRSQRRLDMLVEANEVVNRPCPDDINRRNLAEVPDAAKGAMAAGAAWATYVTATLIVVSEYIAVTGARAANPVINGIAGCVGGALSNKANNVIVGIRGPKDWTSVATNCVTGGLTSAVLGQYLASAPQQFGAWQRRMTGWENANDGLEGIELTPGAIGDGAVAATVAESAAAVDEVLVGEAATAGALAEAESVLGVIAVLGAPVGI